MTYLLLILVTFAIGFGAQGYVNHQLNKYSHVPNTSQMTGRDVAVGMLNYYGIQGVEVRMGREGQDFFNPKDNSITLGPDSYNGRSITATATACHEVGHAWPVRARLQTYEGCAPRSVPVVNLASNTWIFILLAGIILNVIGLVDVAIALYAVAVLFQIVTLPVEFDASRRALAYMQSTGIPGGEQAGAASVLRACAFTYLAAALISILQLLYLLSARDN